MSTMRFDKTFIIMVIQYRQMMRNHLTLLTLIAAAFFLVCCTPATATPGPLPGIDIPPDRMITWIKLEDSREMGNSHQNGELLGLELINISDKAIVFPGDFGVRVLTWGGVKWTDVSNNSFTGSQLHSLPTTSEYPLGLIIETLPYVPGLSKPVEIRIIVVGHIGDMDGEQVGAYIDVPLNPVPVTGPSAKAITDN